MFMNMADYVKELFIKGGCKNNFVTKGWGCTHPDIGDQRKVRIFPTDFDYSAEFAALAGLM